VTTVSLLHSFPKVALSTVIDMSQHIEFQSGMGPHGATPCCVSNHSSLSWETTPLCVPTAIRKTFYLVTPLAFIGYLLFSANVLIAQTRQCSFYKCIYSPVLKITPLPGSLSVCFDYFTSQAWMRNYQRVDSMHCFSVAPTI
jgi:hypothetical protein